MPIPFTQYLPPDGRHQQIEITRGLAIEKLARMLEAAGVRFEAEVLGDMGVVSLECVMPQLNDDPLVLAGEVAPNGPAVPEAVDRLVYTAFLVWQRIKKESEETGFAA